MNTNDKPIERVIMLTSRWIRIYRIGAIIYSIISIVFIVFFAIRINQINNETSDQNNWAYTIIIHEGVFVPFNLAEIILSVIIWRLGIMTIIAKVIVIIVGMVVS